MKAEILNKKRPVEDDTNRKANQNKTKAHTAKFFLKFMEATLHIIAVIMEQR